MMVYSGPAISATVVVAELCSSFAVFSFGKNFNRQFFWLSYNVAGEQRSTLRCLELTLFSLNGSQIILEMESCHLLLVVSPSTTPPLELKSCSQSFKCRVKSCSLNLKSTSCYSHHRFRRSTTDRLLACFALEEFNRRANFLLSETSQRSNDFKVKASAVPDNAGESAKPNKLSKTLQLGAMFAVWYLLNIYFNIYNKQVSFFFHFRVFRPLRELNLWNMWNASGTTWLQVLKVFPFPATVSAFQFGCGTMLVLLMWALNLHQRPKINRSQVYSSLLFCHSPISRNKKDSMSGNFRPFVFFTACNKW